MRAALLPILLTTRVSVSSQQAVANGPRRRLEMDEVLQQEENITLLADLAGDMRWSTTNPKHNGKVGQYWLPPGMPVVVLHSGPFKIHLRSFLYDQGGMPGPPALV